MLDSAMNSLGRKVAVRTIQMRLLCVRNEELGLILIGSFICVCYHSTCVELRVSTVEVAKRGGGCGREAAVNVEVGGELTSRSERWMIVDVPRFSIVVVERMS